MATGSKFGLERSWMHKLQSNGRKAHPTIEPTPGFSASSDAERIHRAMKGAGTDEETIINILARRTNYERQEIAATYMSTYDKPLIKAIKDDTSGQFKTILCELIYDLPYMLAKSLYYAMKGLGTNERVLIEVLICLWNDELKAVADAYKKVLEDKGCDKDDRTLLSDLESDTSGDFQYALTLLAQGERDEVQVKQLRAITEQNLNTIINTELSGVDAKDLLAAGAARVGTNEKRITRIMVGRTPFQLKADADTYQEMFGKSLYDDLQSELSGSYRSLITSLLRYATDRPTMIAEWLHDAMSGLGTRDYTLMRILITRAEIDLNDVKDAYLQKYGKALVDEVASDSSGDYQKTLLKILA